MAVPLRKSNQDGALYQRRLVIENALDDLLKASRLDLAERCKISDPSDTNYIPTECLLHLVRECRSDNSDHFFAALFRALRQRVVVRLPSPEIKGGSEGKVLVSQRNIKIRDYVMDRFQGMLMRDRAGYDERLDYFEVNFDAALATLRLDGRKKAFKEEKRSETIGYDDETSELNAEVEEAAAAQNPISESKLDDPVYRSRLYGAIDSLPDNQRRVIELLLRGIQIDSQEPNVPTIVRFLNCTEKTVRNRRDRAYAAIRKALETEEEA
jgi:hypothetical protein